MRVRAAPLPSNEIKNIVELIQNVIIVVSVFCIVSIEQLILFSFSITSDYCMIPVSYHTSTVKNYFIIS